MLRGPHQSRRILKRQRPQQDRINHTENRCVRADGKRQSKHGDSGETGTLDQHPQAEANVLPEVIPPKPATGFVKALLGLRHVAEGAARGGSRLLLTQALFLQALDLKLQMGLDFGAEVAGRPLSSEHGPSPPSPPARESVQWPSRAASTACSL